MKEDKIIIGAELVPGKMMKLVLDEVVTVKPKIGLMDLMGGSLDETVKKIQPYAKQKTIVMMQLEEWRRIGYKVGSKISIEILPVECPTPEEVERIGK